MGLWGAGIALVLATAYFAGEATEREHPLDFYLLPPDTGSRHDQLAAVIQKRIATCMSILGLSYLPYVEPQPVVPDADLSLRDWAAKWGFGISTRFGTEPPSLPPILDPNRAYMDTLGETERTTYRAALYGDATNEGCIEAATRDIEGRYRVVRDRTDQALEPLSSVIAGDARVIKAEQDWSRCIETVSPDVTARPELYPKVSRDLQAELEAIVGPPPGRAQYDRRALIRLQEHERRIAIRAADCETEYVRIFDAARVDLERQFVRENAELLAQIRAEWVAIDTELGVSAR